MIKLLFTGGGGAGNEALNRLLAARYTVHFADADRAAISPSIPDDRRHVIPFATDPHFATRVTELCRSLAIDLLIPGVDEELPTLAALAREEQTFRILLPTADYIEIMLDKLATARTLISRGLPAPQTTTLDRAAEIGFPCIAKPRHGRGSRGVRTLASADQADAYLRLSGLAPDQIVAQKLLSGQEFTVLMAATQAGKLRAVVPVKVELKRGITLRAETVAAPQVTDACRTIHAALPVPGCYNIQLMLCPDGRAVPFEINPRVSTTLCLGVAAGIDPFSLFLSTDDAGQELLPFARGIRLMRHWNNLFTETRGES